MGQIDNNQDLTNLLDSQPHVYKHMITCATSAAVRAAIQLQIPAVISENGKPMSLHDLASAAKIPSPKTNSLRRLMRMLENAGFIAITMSDHSEEKYGLTSSSELLIPGKTPNLAPFSDLMNHPAVLSPLGFLADWFKDDEIKTPFTFTHGETLWGYIEKNSEFKGAVDRAMDCDSETLSLFIGKCESTFEGVKSVVDVGGGRGDLAKIIVREFPGIRCTVLDVPHVVADLCNDGDVKFEAGDMFKHIPRAELVMLKLMLHAWNDEECVTILTKAREAVENVNGQRGKVVIIDIVLRKTDDPELNEAKLKYDFMTMVFTNGWERSEEDWKTLFLKAGFSAYKISARAGIRSLIEVFP